MVENGDAHIGYVRWQTQGARGKALNCSSYTHGYTIIVLYSRGVRTAESLKRRKEKQKERRGFRMGREAIKPQYHIENVYKH